MPRLLRFIAAVVPSLLLMAPPAFAQAEWPAGNTITLVLGFAPGGPNDLVGRALAQRLTESLKQQVIVDNKPGANGNIAAGIVARANPEGYTFLYNSSSLALSPALYKKLAVDPLRDLVPVNGTATLPLVMVAAPSFPPNNFREWTAVLKKDPGKYNFGSAGAGNLAHIGVEMVLKANGLQAVHAPYKGSSEALTGLLSGATQFQLDSVNSPLALIKGGKLKPLFVTSRQRSPVLPDVPTLAESGGQDFEISGWQGIMAPAKIPPAIIQKMAAEIAKVMSGPEMKASLAAQGGYAISTTPERYAAFFAEELARFKKVVGEIGLSLD